jgi:AcrR family transcriptional regulator
MPRTAPARVTNPATGEQPTATGPPAERAPRRATATKARIVAAAEEVVLRDGVAHLTIEGAANEAGLSKGGVLYHFPTRFDLVAAMVAKIIEEFDRDIEARLAVDKGGPGAFGRAYVGATFVPVAVVGAPDRDDRLGAAVIAAAAAEPALLIPLQRAARRWQRCLEADGVDPAVATAVRMACDGLWLCDLFGLAAPTGTARTAMAAELLRLVTPPSPPPGR